MGNEKIRQTMEQLKKGGRNRTTLICLGVASIGILMILLSGGKEQGNPQETKTMLDENAYNAQFVAQLQADLTRLVCEIDGVGEAEVLVTLESGVQYVYATENKSSGDRSVSGDESISEKASSETSIVIVDGENGKAPVLLQRIEPVVMGVLVVCDGGGDIRVQQAVTDAVTTVCGIGSNRVTVTKKSN